MHSIGPFNFGNQDYVFTITFVVDAVGELEVPDVNTNVVVGIIYIINIMPAVSFSKSLHYRGR